MATELEPEIVVVTGMSGAGRSTVGNVLEDLGWFVVDNLPPQMLKPLVELSERGGDKLPNIAAIVDVRGGELFRAFDEIVREIRGSYRIRVIFLDADDLVLVRRFEQVRRPHPLQKQGTLVDGITAERRLMADIRGNSDIIIDTSELTPHELATRIRERYASGSQAHTQLTLMSFGFKYGLPTDADMVADIRFLPNPFWVPELRALSGRDAQVAEYVFAQDGAESFLDSYTETLKVVIDGYRRENKQHALFAIGCTGGKHRSVAMTEAIALRLASVDELEIRVTHRDLGRE